LVDPEKTTSLWQAHGKIQPEDVQGDEWKIGRQHDWGWISYDPQLNLVYTAAPFRRVEPRAAGRATTNGR